MKSLLLFINSTIFPLLVAGVWLVLYFSKKQTKFYKKKWVLAACILSIGFAGWEFYNSYEKYEHSQAPSSEKVQVAFSEKGQLAQKDISYKSEDGYSIVIPEGFSYLSERQGMISLIAEKVTSQNKKYIIGVSKIRSTVSLFEFTQDLIKEMASRYDNFQYKVSGELYEREVRFSFEDFEGLNKGMLRLIKKEYSVYNITVVSKNISNVVENIPPELEHSIQSFKLL